MFLRPLSQITLSDVQGLVGNVAEDHHIEFKQAPVGTSDADRKEFVADVTAFANASGGQIIFGVAEGADGVASKVTGIALKDLDKEERRLADMIRNGTEPRLSDFEFRWIEHSRGRSVLVLRVPRSWRAPHRVTLGGHDRFYLRNTRGKHPMNTDELRTAFTLGQTLIDRIDQFRLDRVDKIARGEVPVHGLSSERPKLVLHAVPLVSFADPPSLRFRYGEVLQSPLGGGGYNHFHTLEGPLTYSPRGTGASSYTLHFRSGVLEGASDFLSEESSKRKTIPLTRIEMMVGQALDGYLDFWRTKEVAPPYYLFVSLVSVAGFVGGASSEFADPSPPLRRANLLLPAQAISDPQSAPVSVLLRPTFDLLWNSFGYSNSTNYDDQGNYRLR